MKALLLDQGLPRSAASLLRERGRHAIHVGECGLAQAADETILEHARREGRVVVTLDSDFHALLAVRAASGPSVIRLRVEGLKAPAACDLIISVMDRARKDIEEGALVSASRRFLRIKRLPIQK